MLRDEQGFTLAEVAVVMAVVALLVWVALPTNSTGDLRLHTLARHIQSDVRYAQERTMTTGQRHRVRFYAAANPSPTNRYDIVAISGGGCTVAAPCPVVHPLTRASGFVVDLSVGPWAGAQLDGTLTLDFDSLGRPDAAKNISLNGGAKVVTVAAETGFVTP